jgi:protoheme IX farnesyltransferase
MPSVVGDQPTRWRSLAYTIALVAVTLVPVWLGYLGVVYATGAAGLGLWFTGQVIRSLIAQHTRVDREVFKASVTYLSILFLAMLLDLSLPWGSV